MPLVVRPLPLGYRFDSHDRVRRAPPERRVTLWDYSGCISSIGCGGLYDAVRARGAGRLTDWPVPD